MDTELIYYLDYSSLCADAGSRGVDKFHTPAEVMNSPLVWSIVDLAFKQAIEAWLLDARLGDFKDFDVFTIFVGRDS